MIKSTTESRIVVVIEMSSAIWWNWCAAQRMLNSCKARSKNKVLQLKPFTILGSTYGSSSRRTRLRVRKVTTCLHCEEAVGWCDVPCRDTQTNGSHENKGKFWIVRLAKGTASANGLLIYLVKVKINAEPTLTTPSSKRDKSFRWYKRITCSRRIKREKKGNNFKRKGLMSLSYKGK